MEPTPDSLRQLAAEMALDLAERMGDLTDEEAQPLMTWAVGQAEAAVQNLLVNEQSHGMHPPEESGERLAAMLKPVGQAVTAINDLIADRDALSLEEMAEKLEFLQQLAQQLPRPPISGAMGLVRYVRSIWEGDLSDTDLIHAILNLLSGQPPTGAEEPETLGEADDQAAA